MNKTLSVNIAGFVFNIEEDAYERLQKYLDNIRINFSNEEEADEIMNDIELRIAELFQNVCAPTKEVIIQNDITEVISILGQPEDFATDSDDSEETAQKQNNSTDNQVHQERLNKRLFRDTDNSTIGGVCSGLGHYFNLDAVVFRIIFLVLFFVFGTGVLLYIILLIVVPEAKTTSDKLEMKGQSINLESIKDHVANFKQTINNPETKNNIKNSINGAVNKGVTAGQSFFNVIAKLLGVAFIIGGVVFTVFFLMLIFGNTDLLPFIGEDRISSISELINLIYPGVNPSPLIFAAFLIVALVPLIGLIITGFKMLSNFKTKSKKLAWGAGILWTIAASVLIFSSIRLASNLKNSKKIMVPVELTNPDTPVLLIDVKDDDQFSNYIDPYDGWDNIELLKADEQNIYFGITELHLKTSPDSGAFKVKLVKKSRGGTEREAIELIEHFIYPIETTDNKLIIPPYLTVPRVDKMRGQFVTVEIVVPNGKSVKFGKNIDRIWRNIDGVYDNTLESYANTVWTNSANLFTTNAPVMHYEY